jgi:hypothetical protein
MSAANKELLHESQVFAEMRELGLYILLFVFLLEYKLELTKWLQSKIGLLK